MSLIITTQCTKCGKKQKMEIRNPKLTVFNKPDLSNKRKICVYCGKSFKIDKNSVN